MNGKKGLVLLLLTATVFLSIPNTVSAKNVECCPQGTRRTFIGQDHIISGGKCKIVDVHNIYCIGCGNYLRSENSNERSCTQHRY